MHRFQKWLSVGLLALTPGIAAADAAVGKSANEQPVKRSKAAVNQDLAERVARAMRKAKLNGYDIEIDVRDGVVTLDGYVLGVEQRASAAKAAASVAGVKGVNNRLKIGEAASGTSSAAAQSTRLAGNPHDVTQASYQPGDGQTLQQAAPQGGPAYGIPNNATPYAAYNQPNLNYAWPPYAQYSGPSQYSASAWPYMGPFYPYPQAPLGWQKVSLEWNAGLWNLDFHSCTSRRWRFLHPKNW